MKNVSIYKPSKSIKGFACSFWVSEKDGCLYATLIKQSGWDEKNQNGIFKDSINDPLKKVNIKLSEVEACGILDCIERGRPFTNYHDFGDAPKSISFVPWMFTPVVDEGEPKAVPTQKGYSFSIVTNPKDPNKNTFYIGFTFAEGRYLREFLIHFLHLSFRRPFEVSEPTPGQAEPVVEATPEPETVEPTNNPEPETSDVLADF